MAFPRIKSLYFAGMGLWQSLKHRLYLRLLDKDLLTIGNGVYLAYGAKISTKTIIGDHTRINGKITVLNGGVMVSIGKYCAIGRDIVIIGANHIINRPALQMALYQKNFDEPAENLVRDKGPIVIGNDVWIGDATTILPGVSVGDGAIIGAGAVVAKDVLPYTVVGGVPAHKIKDRFPEEIKNQLLAIKWWDWSENKIRANREFFMMDLNAAGNIDLASIIRAE